MRKELYIKIFIFFLVGFSINFFSAQVILKSPLGNVRFIYVFVAVLLSLPYIFKRKGGFVLPVQTIFFAQLVSMVMANIFWGQSYIDSFKSTILLMAWPFFFYLLEKGVSVKTIENIIIIYGLAYVVCFFFQYTHSSVVYFGNVEEFKEERGVTRINFPGGGVFALSSFIALSRIGTGGKNKPLYIMFVILGVVITVMQVTRQAIALILVIYLYHFMKDAQLYKKILVLLVFFVTMFYVFNSNNAIVRGLKDTQKEDSSLGSNYIRVLSGTYYLTKFSPTFINAILGNGTPYKGTKDASKYGEYEYRLQSQFGFYLSDVGMIGLYAMFGIAPVIAYIFIFIKSFTINVPNNYYYVKYHLWSVLATCLTSDSVYSYNGLVPIIFVLYIYQLLYERSQNGNTVIPVKKKSVYAWG